MFYVQDPCDKRWLVVLYGKTIGINLDDGDSTLHTCHTPFSTRMPTINGEDEFDVIHANCSKYDEGELINIV